MKTTICLSSFLMTILVAPVVAQPAGLGGCLKVTAYGQRAANGEDLSRYGKVLKLSFRPVSDSVGIVDLSAGVAGKRFGVFLGIRQIESRLPWLDTALCAELVASGDGVLDAQGQAAVPLDLTGLYPDALIAPRLRFYLQAVSLGDQDQPLTSHGLAFEVCRTPADTTGTDHDQWTITNQRYRSHQTFGQIAEGYLGAAGWRVTMSIIVPSDGWTFAHDRTVRAGGKTWVLLSLKAPDKPTGDRRGESVTVDLGTSDPGSVRVHIADVVDGAPRLYELAAYLR